MLHGLYKGELVDFHSARPIPYTPHTMWNNVQSTYLNQPTSETDIPAELLPQIHECDSASCTHPAIHHGTSQMPDIPGREKGDVHPPGPLTSNFNPFGDDLQTINPTANSSEPIIERNNALGLSLESPQSRITDIRSPSQIYASSSQPTIEPNNVLGLFFDTHPSVTKVESSQIFTAVPHGFWSFRDEAFQWTSSRDNLFREDLQTAEPTIEPNNALGLLPQTQGRDSDSCTHQDFWQGSSQFPDILTQTFVPNPTSWKIPVPPPGPLRSNFDPFREDLQNAEPSANPSQPTIDPNNGLGLSLDPPRSSVEAVFYEAPVHSNFDTTTVDDSQLLGERFTKNYELRIKFGGKLGRQVRWIDVLPCVDQFIKRTSSATYTNHSLTIIWEPSSSDFDRWVCGRTFQQLFDRLKEPVTNGGVLSTLDRISITMPEKAEEVDVISAPWPGNIAEQTVHDVERIDLRAASSLKEFLWKGSFHCFTERFSYIPADSLTTLSITGCHISVNDALALLQPCSSLKEVRLETVHDTKDCESGDLFTLRPGTPFKFALKKLSITSYADLSPILKVINWAPDDLGPTVALNFLDTSSQDAKARLCAPFIPSNATLNLKGNFLKERVDEIRMESY